MKLWIDLTMREFRGEISLMVLKWVSFGGCGDGEKGNFREKNQKKIFLFNHQEQYYYPSTHPKIQQTCKNTS